MGLVTLDTTKGQVNTPYYLRKIKCPRHFLISPTVEVFLREPIPELKGVSESCVRTYGVKKTRIVRDRYGNKVLDWKKIYGYEKTGKVLQPTISTSFAIEQIYDPKNPICHVCKFRCKEGKGKINEMSIKRLHG